MILKLMILGSGIGALIWIIVTYMKTRTVKMAEYAEDALNDNVYYHRTFNSNITFRIKRWLWRDSGYGVAETRLGSYAFFKLTSILEVGNRSDIFRKLCTELGPTRAILIAKSLEWTIKLKEI